MRESIKPQNKEQITKLKYSNQTKKEVSYINAVNAILELQNNDKKVNFSSVAKVAGVSTNYLYNHEKLRITIEKARGDNIKEVSVSGNIKQDIYKVKFEKMKKELEEKEIQIKVLNEKNIELLLENEELKNN
jgi:hypothetical protein